MLTEPNSDRRKHFVVENWSLPRIILNPGASNVLIVSFCLTMPPVLALLASPNSKLGHEIECGTLYKKLSVSWHRATRRYSTKVNCNFLDIISLPILGSQIFPSKYLLVSYSHETSHSFSAGGGVVRRFNNCCTCVTVERVLRYGI